MLSTNDKSGYFGVHYLENRRHLDYSGELLQPQEDDVTDPTIAARNVLDWIRANVAPGPITVDWTNVAADQWGWKRLQGHVDMLRRLGFDVKLFQSKADSLPAATLAVAAAPGESTGLECLRDNVRRATEVLKEFEPFLLRLALLLLLAFEVFSLFSHRVSASSSPAPQAGIHAVSQPAGTAASLRPSQESPPAAPPSCQ